MALKVLILGVHSDDMEYGCGGTAKLLADAGCEVTLGWLTSPYHEAGGAPQTSDSFALLGIKDKLTVLEMRSYIISDEGKGRFLCEFHNIDRFLCAILTARSGIRITEPPKRKRLFARNEIPYEEPGAPDWARIGKALNLALYNYLDGRGLRKSVYYWRNVIRKRK